MTVSPDAKPKLPRGVRLTHNEAQGGWVLLAPERVFKADAIAADIVKRCTGESSFAAIVDDLAQAYSAPRERVLADVTVMLRGLAEITHRCPLGCPYCSNPLALEPREEELDLSTWARVFDEAVALGVLQVHL